MDGGSWIGIGLSATAAIIAALANYRASKDKTNTQLQKVRIDNSQKLIDQLQEEVTRVNTAREIQEKRIEELHSAQMACEVRDHEKAMKLVTAESQIQLLINKDREKDHQLILVREEITALKIQLASAGVHPTGGTL